MSNAMGELITVIVPIQLRKRGGRRRIIVAEGPPVYDRKHAESLVLAIARAHHWKELIDSGKFTSISELAKAIGLDVSYAARLYRLTYLSPAIVESILAGEEPSGLSLNRLTQVLPVTWDGQRGELGVSASGAMG